MVDFHWLLSSAPSAQEPMAAGIGISYRFMFYIKNIAAGATEGPRPEGGIRRELWASIGADLNLSRCESKDLRISLAETLTIRASKYSSFLPETRS
jgi:hypothetical protein